MLENGYIKLWRALLNWQWYHNEVFLKIFIHLILTSNIRDHNWKNEIIKRGSRVISYDNFAKETNFSVQQVRTAFKKMSATGELTIKTTNKYTVVTVNNFEYWQSVTQTSTNNKELTNRFDEQNINIFEEYENSTQSLTNKNAQKSYINTDKNSDMLKIPTQTITINQQSNNNQITNNQQQYKKNKEYKKDKKVERGSETLPNATPTPTLEQVIDFVFENNLRVNPNKFYYYYENKCWKGVNNWKMKLMEWNETERPHQSNFENKTENNVSFDLDKYEQQLRQTPSLDWLD